ncbi:LysM peptidoglycan-binding domain-containing protein [Salinicoccus siamensis]|uniref:LysM peptidoglycan-binding domain-containing protein n=1 Tax=Salinicoccus siamensis TaxID=381830 RepID=A0ABV5Z5W4_9STAP
MLSIATVTTLTGVASHNVSAADYTVESGDTLWGLANENGTSVSNLKEMNNLSSDLIVPGEVLEMDEKKEETHVKEDNQGIYTIKSGDMLYKIGQKFNVDYKQIKKWNNLSSDMIYAGKTLIVSADAVPAEQKAPVVTEATTQSNAADTQGQADTVNQQVEAEKTEAQPSNQNNEKEAPAVVEQSQNNTEAAEQSVQTTHSDNASQQVEPKQAATQPANQNNEKESSNVAQTSNQNRTEDVQQSANENNQNVNQSSQETPAVVENTSNNEVATQNVNSQETTQVQAPVPQAPAPSVASGSYGSNYYMTGDCTWYVFERRKEMGASVSNSWGDAKNWASAARSEGLQVNNTPSVGAIMQSAAFQNGSYSFGHVAVVEAVNADGSIVVSEMNWSGGVGNKTTRTVSASSAASHNFIH